MIAFPNCKINIGLNILSKRDDGFHNLETVFYPVPLKDALEILPQPGNNKKEEISFSSSGLLVEGKPGDNLCIKAYHLLKKDFPGLPAIQMHLLKAIPMGAGLGGGSSDAAFTLTMLNEKFNLGLSTTQLTDYSLTLGSDCPFFINNKPGFATSRGEIIENIQLDLSGYTLLLINPGIHVNTGWAFNELAKIKKEGNNLSPANPKKLDELVKLPVSKWKENIFNDFEIPVFNQYHKIKEIKDSLYKNGAVYASMSGSGSTVYGLFEKTSDTSFELDKSHFSRRILL